MDEKNKDRVEWGRATGKSFDEIAISSVTGLLTWFPVPGHDEFLPDNEENSPQDQAGC